MGFNSGFKGLNVQCVDLKMLYRLQRQFSVGMMTVVMTVVIIEGRVSELF